MRRTALALVAFAATPVVVQAATATAAAPAVAPQPARVAQALPQRLAPAAPGRTSLDATGPAAVGIPRTCPVRHAYPTDATPAQVRAQLAQVTGIRLVGAEWTNPQRAGIVKIVWETLDSISCTDYLTTITKGQQGFTLNAGPISGWAWGDWGLTRPGAVTLDFAKWQAAYDSGDQGRLARILVHELGHAWSRTPHGATVHARFDQLYARTGQFSSYGNNANENFSEAIGYFVARCAQGNPYDARTRNASGRFDGYYRLVRDEVFGGRTFGPAVGEAPQCTVDEPRVAPATSTPSGKAVVRVPNEDLDGLRVVRHS